MGTRVRVARSRDTNSKLRQPRQDFPAFVLGANGLEASATLDRQAVSDDCVAVHRR
jgi:hypothetical protein